MRLELPIVARVWKRRPENELAPGDHTGVPKRHHRAASPVWENHARQRFAGNGSKHGGGRCTPRATRFVFTLHGRRTPRGIFFAGILDPRWRATRRCPLDPQCPAAARRRIPSADRESIWRPPKGEPEGRVRARRVDVQVEPRGAHILRRHALPYGNTWRSAPGRRVVEMPGPSFRVRPGPLVPSRKYSQPKRLSTRRSAAWSVVEMNVRCRKTGWAFVESALR